MRDASHADDGRGFSGVSRGRNDGPDAGFYVQAGVEVGVGDLLHIGNAEDADVLLQQSAIGMAPLMVSNFGESSVRLSSRKRSCPAVWLGPPDHVEAVASPGARQICQRTQRVEQGKGEVDGVFESR